MTHPATTLSPRVHVKSCEQACPCRQWCDSAHTGQARKKPHKAAFKRGATRVSQAHRDTALGHQGLGLAHGVLAVVENAGSQHRIGTALLHAIGQVIQVAHSA